MLCVYVHALHMHTMPLSVERIKTAVQAGNEPYISTHLKQNFKLTKICVKDCTIYRHKISKYTFVFKIKTFNILSVRDILELENEIHENVH